MEYPVEVDKRRDRGDRLSSGVSVRVRYPLLIKSKSCLSGVIIERVVLFCFTF